MNMKRNMKWLQLAFFVLVAVGCAAMFTGRHAVLRLALTGEGNGWLIGYPQWIRGPIGAYAVMAGLVVVWAVLGRWVDLLRRETSPAFLRYLDVCATLRILPLLAAIQWLSILPGILGTIGSHAYLFGIPLVAALFLEKAVGKFNAASPQDGPARKIEIRWVWGLGALLFAGYFAMGMDVNGKIGTTMGDEAHYLTMAESLHRDGDLDLSNNLPTPLPTEQAKLPKAMGHHHLMPGPQGGAYSYHSSGLPLVAFWVNHWGGAGQQAFLALIAVWATLGVFVLCRRCGAGIKSSGCVSAVLALSFVWAFYAIRYLPEMLGCGLAAWAFWSVWAQRSHPKLATLTALICCLYMPFAHARFVTPSVLLAGIFCLEALGCAEEPFRRRLVRIFLFGGLYAAGGLVLLARNLHMYGTASAYNPGMLLSNPAFMWGMFIDSRNICAVFPLTYLFFIVPLALLLKPGLRKRMLLWPYLVLAGILVTSCSVYISGGACAPGRFLLMALPLFAPITAIALERVQRGGRVWFWFLGLLSVFMLLVALSHFGKDFSVPLATHSLRTILRLPAGPVPLIAVRYVPFDGAMTLASFSAILLFAVSFLLFIPPIRFRNACVGFMLTGVVCMAAVIQQKTGDGSEAVFQFGNRIRMEKYRWLRVPASAPAVPLLDAFRRQNPPGRRPLLVTTRPREQVPSDPDIWVFSTQDIGSTDWKSRGWYWHLLHRPITAQHRGKMLFYISGEISGEAEAVFSIRHGSYTLDEGSIRKKSESFDLVFVIPLEKGRGDLLPLVRLDGGEGDLRIDRVQYALFNDQMIADARFEYGPGEWVLIDSANTRYEP